MENNWVDTYGTGKPEYYYGTAANGLYYPSTWEQLGIIYQCPNIDGFEPKEDAILYADENNIEYNDWRDIICNSSCFNGYFYSDKNEELHEGYPC